jgi:protein-tyrosine phosphatase
LLFIHINSHPIFFLVKNSSKVMIMIDLHTHILPNVDDGSASTEESFNMCRMAKDDGINTVVATPHTLNGVYNHDGDQIKQEVMKLNSLLKREGIEVEVLPGSDVRISPDLLEQVKKGKALTVNDNQAYLMIEFPGHFLFPSAKGIVVELLRRGIIPIISHPERYPQVHNNRAMLFELVREGALVQMTAMSLTGEFGKGIRRCAEDLLEQGLVHIIASDAHNSTVRPPILSKAVEAAATIIGDEDAFKMVTSIPQTVLRGEG